jgi:hypothetical protein
LHGANSTIDHPSGLINQRARIFSARGGGGGKGQKLVEYRGGGGGGEETGYQFKQESACWRAANCRLPSRLCFPEKHYAIG